LTSALKVIEGDNHTSLALEVIGVVVPLGHMKKGMEEEEPLVVDVERPSRS
jgi:hypothetical protein